MRQVDVIQTQRVKSRIMHRRRQGMPYGMPEDGADSSGRSNWHAATLALSRWTAGGTAPTSCSGLFRLAFEGALAAPLRVSINPPEPLFLASPRVNAVEEGRSWVLRSRTVNHAE